MKQELLILAESALTEDTRIEFKRSFSPEKKAAFWVEIVKDIIAIANTHGGAIIFGIEDDGTKSESAYRSLLDFDPAKITDQVHKYTGTHFAEFQITEVARSNGKFPCLLIYPNRLPIVFTKVGSYEVAPDKQKTAFSVGTVYFRHGAKSQPATQDDLRDSFLRELTQVREEWLGNIRKVVEAEPGASVVVTDNGTIDAEVRLTRDPSAPAVRVQELSETHPYRQNELINEVKRRQVEKKIRFNSHDVLSIKLAENLTPESHPDLMHKPHAKSSPQYSLQFIDFVCEKIAANENYLLDCRKIHKQSRY